MREELIPIFIFVASLILQGWAEVGPTPRIEAWSLRKKPSGGIHCGSNGERIFRRVLIEVGANNSKAAEILGLVRKALYPKLEKI